MHDCFSGCLAEYTHRLRPARTRPVCLHARTRPVGLHARTSQLCARESSEKVADNRAEIDPCGMIEDPLRMRPASDDVYDGCADAKGGVTSLTLIPHTKLSRQTLGGEHKKSPNHSCSKDRFTRHHCNVLCEKTALQRKILYVGKELSSRMKKKRLGPSHGNE